jgi:hypothetical protein
MEGSDPGLGFDPRRDHGDRRWVHGGALSPLFELAPNAQAFVTLIGAITAMFAANHRPCAERHQAHRRLFDLFAAGYMFVAMGVGPIPSGCSISSRTPSSRGCCFSAPAR